MNIFTKAWGHYTRLAIHDRVWPSYHFQHIADYYEQVMRGNFGPTLPIALSDDVS